MILGVGLIGVGCIYLQSESGAIAVIVEAGYLIVVDGIVGGVISECIDGFGGCSDEETILDREFDDCYIQAAGFIGKHASENHGVVLLVVDN